MDNGYPYTFSDVYQLCEAYLPEEDLMNIKKSYELAEVAHREQFRKSGEPYILLSLIHI